MDKKIIKAYTLKNAIEHEGKAKIGSVIPGLFAEGLKKSKIKEIMPKVKKIVKKINSLTPEKQKELFENYKDLVGQRPEREGLPELPNAENGVITRMSPSPSGALTLGHIFTILPNFLYTQKYRGEFYIRIEDTNPEKIYKPAYKMIKKEAKWLCKNKVKFIIQSNRINTYYQYVEKLIEKNAVYVCTCNQEKFRKLILKQKPCPCRAASKKETKEKWKKMFNEFKEGEAVLRFKSDLFHKNPAMRDFPLARINETSHPLQKNKYRVWPLMNLAVTIDDIEQGMTHIIRGKDHKDNAKRQKMIYDVLKKPYPWTGFIGKMHFTDLIMSASKMREGIESGKYKGWDDPQLPTVASLKKQGYKPEAFWEFTKQRGISEVDKVISKDDFFEILNNFQKNLSKNK